MSRAGRPSACAMRCTADHYFHAMYFPRAFHIHPLNYALGLAAAAETAGARIFEGTPALSLDTDGVRKRVVTPKARVRASTSCWPATSISAALMPRIAGTLLPVWTYLVTTAPLGPRLPTPSAIAAQSATPISPTTITALLTATGCCGRAARPRGRPTRSRYARRLKADIAAVYPQIGEVEVEHVWSGVLGSALHRMPQTRRTFARSLDGQRLRRPRPEYHRDGRQSSSAAGIADGDDTWRLFSPYEFVWAGGQARPRGEAGPLLVVQRPRTLRGAPGPRARAGIRARNGAGGARAAAARSPQRDPICARPRMPAEPGLGRPAGRSGDGRTRRCRSHRR